MPPFILSFIQLILTEGLIVCSMCFSVGNDAVHKTDSDVCFSIALRLFLWGRKEDKNINDNNKAFILGKEIR